MTQSIERGALRAFLQPYFNQAHRAEHRVHILCGTLHYRSGYICGLDEDAVGKYSDGSNSTTWIAFAEIDAVEVCDLNGALLQRFTVTDGGAA